jgi:hypothetical protein
MDPLVRITGDTNGFDFQPGNVPKRTNVTTYYVGDFGPYTVSLPVDTATPDAIQQAIQSKVNALRSLGAIQ